MLEKSRIVRRRDGESPFHIFHYILYGTSTATRSELLLQSSNNSLYADEVRITG